jgi:uroporphyrinogen-III synthase
MIATTHTLPHLHILVTRPEHQSQALVDRLVQAGALPLCVPSIAIQPLEDNSDLLYAAQQLPRTDIVIFTSANAVRYAVPMIKKHASVWPPSIMTLAIGEGTQRCLAEYGWREVITPTETFNSEALLRLPPLQYPHHKQIVIFCGTHPRPLLAKALTQRQAHVHLAFCYERVCPNIDITPLLEQLKHGKVDVIISTSNESLLNLFAMFGSHKTWLLNIPILVISPRMAATLMTLGYSRQPIVAQTATDSSIMAALTQWYEEQHHER